MASAHLAPDVDFARLVARIEIQDAMSNFTHGSDERDPVRWLAAFHEDAVLEVDSGECILRGHEEILGWARDLWRFAAMSHLTTDTLIEFTDDSNATGLSRGLGLFQVDDGSFAMATARLEDQFTRVAGSWRIARRKVTIAAQVRISKTDDLVLRGRAS